MHLAVYRRTGARAVVHTHSPYATAVSTVAAELPPVHYLLVFLGGAVRVAPYATPGSEALGERLVEALDGRSAALLQNHGAVAVGASLEQAYAHALVVEWVAALWARAKVLGEPRVLSPDEVAAAAASLQGYGGLGTAPA
jgi:L-fuculose-phosphate aldolase